MKPELSKNVLVVGFFATAVAAMISFDAQIYLQVVIGFVSPILIVAGVRRERPGQRWPWWSLATLTAGLNIATVIGLVDYRQLSNAGGFPNREDLACLIAYAFGIAGVIGIGHMRDDRRDPTHVVDALIVGFAACLVVWTFLALPYLLDPAQSINAKFSVAIFTGIDIAWGAASVRILMGPGAKPASYWFVIVSIIMALLTDTFIGIDQAGIAFPGQWTLNHLTPSVQYLLLAAAALHPKMRTITVAASAEMGQMTPRRLGLLTMCVVAPPVVLALQLNAQYLRSYILWLVPLWVAMSLLVMYRLRGLMRAREQATADLHKRRSESRFRAMVEHSNDVIAVVNGDGEITYISPSCLQMFGRYDEELIGRNIVEDVHPDDCERMRAVLDSLDTSDEGRCMNLELRFPDVSRNWLTLDVTATDLRDDPGIEGIVLNAHDVTRRKSLEEDLRRRVLHDSLTGIANRVLFHERAAHALARRGSDHFTAALFIDIDDFKTVNDSLGHSVGDELLKVTALRLRLNVRDADTPARLGGDEFAVLLEQMTSVEDVMSVGRHLVEVLQEPFDFDGKEIRISASIGVAMSGEQGDVDVLLRNADVAMYHAKWGGKGRVELFDERMHEAALERFELKADLVHVIERNELHLVYQPLVDIATRRTLGFEALLRWKHPKRGLIAPDRFIPLAEETGVIVPIGAWVIDEATRQLAEWQRQFPHQRLGMSVNLSPRQLEETSVMYRVKAALEASQLDASVLTLELTESTVMDDASCRERLIELGHLGVGIAADDFGSGFASYAALQKLPFTMLKIDRSLLSGIDTTDGRAESQLQSIIDMAHATGIAVVAEGIETADQLELLESMGCDAGQGYLFSRPVDVEVASQLLAAELGQLGTASA